MRIRYYLVVCISILVLSGCESWVWQQQNIPKEAFHADILYSTIVEKKDQTAQDMLGYSYTSEKTGEPFELGYYAPIHPYFLDSSTIIFISKNGEPGMVSNYFGDLVIFSNDHHDTVCKKGNEIIPFNGNIVLSDFDNIYLLSGKDCSVVKTLLSRQDINTLSENPQIMTFSISSDGDFIIFQVFKSDILYKVTLSDKKIKKIIDNGTNPSISPDQKWVAYVAPDGIRLCEIDGSKSALIVAIYNLAETAEGGVTPEPQWSPDSKELIYHKCIDHDCTKINDYNIYLYNLETKKETLVIKGGIFPSWNYYK